MICDRWGICEYTSKLKTTSSGREPFVSQAGVNAGVDYAGQDDLGKPPGRLL